MTKQPKISVLMPAYNHDKYIDEAIQSVLDQTYPEFELIIADDQSTDNTWARIQSFHDERIKSYRHEENIGAHATINELLGKASGEIIAIINSDDIFHNERLEKTVSVLVSKDHWLVGSQLVLIDSNSAPILDKEHWWNQWYFGLLNDFEMHADIKRTILTGNIFITTSNFVFKKEILQKVGAFENLRYTHDYKFLLKILFITQTSEKIAFLQEKMMSYRLHDSNTIRENPLAANHETFKLLQEALCNLTLTREEASALSQHFATISSRIENIYSTEQQILRHELANVLLINQGILSSKTYKLASHLRDAAQWAGALMEKISGKPYAEEKRLEPNRKAEP